jgi:hypothetical protein
VKTVTDKAEIALRLTIAAIRRADINLEHIELGQRYADRIAEFYLMVAKSLDDKISNGTYSLGPDKLG